MGRIPSLAVIKEPIHSAHRPLKARAHALRGELNASTGLSHESIFVRIFPFSLTFYILRLLQTKRGCYTLLIRATAPFLYFLLNFLDVVDKAGGW